MGLEANSVRALSLCVNKGPTAHTSTQSSCAARHDRTIRVHPVCRWDHAPTVGRLGNRYTPRIRFVYCEVGKRPPLLYQRRFDGRDGGLRAGASRPGLRKRRRQRQRAKRERGDACGLSFGRGRFCAEPGRTKVGIFLSFTSIQYFPDNISRKCLRPHGQNAIRDSHTMM